MADLPADIITELRHAAMRGNSEGLLELIDQIRTDHDVIADGQSDTLADALADLVHTYQFKRIADLLPADENKI